MVEVTVLLSHHGSVQQEDGEALTGQRHLEYRQSVNQEAALGALGPHLQY